MNSASVVRGLEGSLSDEHLEIEFEYKALFCKTCKLRVLPIPFRL